MVSQSYFFNLRKSNDMPLKYDKNTALQMIHVKIKRMQWNKSPIALDSSYHMLLRQEQWANRISKFSMFMIFPSQKQLFPVDCENGWEAVVPASTRTCQQFFLSIFRLCPLQGTLHATMIKLSHDSYSSCNYRTFQSKNRRENLILDSMGLRWIIHLKFTDTILSNHTIMYNNKFANLYKLVNHVKIFTLILHEN